MKRFLLSLVLIFFTINTLFAQRDTEHWIAPYYDSFGGYTNMLYLSTDSVTPFDVVIYNNNAVVTTVTISKGNPQTYKVTNNLISTGTLTEAFNVGTKGLYLKGAKPFYCSLRLAQSIHGEVITSKGKAGIGKKFFVAQSPNTNLDSYYNFTAGILATEDNTNVTVTWNNTPGVVFINGSAVTGNTHSVTLQKGQSFIYAGSGSQDANKNGFMGAKIVSDKPITLTNGSCNGNFSATPSGTDPVLDQSVPVDRLGNTFAMVKTRSTQPSLNMEGGLIIATEDNTEVYLNDSTTPAATLDAGQWYRINETSYVTPPGATNHKNMFISTTKNVYVYQFIGIDNNA
ncbi:MAG TPA: gliding motility protein, partial [Sphingobacterium sp.]|nr:gliding motility protein [Sphingobacterium sp.]